MEAKNCSPTELACWLKMLIFVIFVASAALLFVAGFELPFCTSIIEDSEGVLSSFDYLLVFWILYATTIACLLPILALSLGLQRAGFLKVPTVVFGVGWTVVLYFLAVDTLCMAQVGVHAISFLPFLVYMVKSPELAKVVNPDALEPEMFLLLIIVVTVGLAVFLGVQWTVRKVYQEFGSSDAQRWFRWASVSMVAGVVAVLPAMSLLSSPSLLVRVCEVLPVETRPLESTLLRLWTLKDEARASLSPAGWQSQGPGAFGDSRYFSKQGVETALASPGPHGGGSASLDMVLDSRKEEDLINARFLDDWNNPKPVDEGAIVASNGPNVIMIILDSLRHSVLSRDHMPRLTALAERGLCLEQHFSGSNRSEAALFSLFYGRVPIAYEETLAQKIAPQLLRSMRLSGYQSILFSATPYSGWGKMERFLNNEYFDEVYVPSWGESYAATPAEDHKILGRTLDMVNGKGAKPLFVVMALCSTHHPYNYPPEFGIHKPVNKRFNWLGSHFICDPNRYKNACLFTDSELAKMINDLDLERNLVIITGDHGESFGEDGLAAHATGTSDIQVRVPCVILGAGVKAQRITRVTSHVDILPTMLHILAGDHVHVRSCDGVDLLAESPPRDVVYVAGERVILVRGDQRLAFDKEGVKAQAEKRLRFWNSLTKTGRRHLIKAQHDDRH